MELIGKLHLLLCRIPGIGEPVARAISWLFAGFPWLAGVRGNLSLEETRQKLIESGEMMDFPFEFSEVENGEFTLELSYCPYGFTSEGHKRACDTAMDMDRVLLRRCGAELIITDTIPEGASRCRMVVRQ
ncbi:MAG: hypothetical protein HOC70_08820 [Gammaproteobacteria bacterium]|jgi:predicted ArsR family transcriptional regulator|nr:hypothetical protein [Gammaproteobacteria bacterium]MBT4493336.1 hypothetical protein [Gammaproteobacteria bacterium]MBT7370633.1 hypothetical protein [Gammaproteobacteria bacterium]